MTILALAIFVIFGIVTIVSYYQDGIHWRTLILGLFSVIGFGGIVDTYTSYVLLGKQELLMRKNFRKTIIKRSDILSVSKEKGCNTQIILKNGNKISLTEIGKTGKSNSINA